MMPPGMLPTPFRSVPPPQEPRSPILPLALGLTIFYAIAVTLYYGSRSPQQPLAVPKASASEPTALIEMAPSGSPPAASSAPSKAAPPSRRNIEDLVRSLVGIWKGEEGTRVYIDPPRPRLGSRAPYHLTVEAKGGGTYGCDFTDSERVKKLDESEWTGRAWCGGVAKGKKAFVGITVSEGKLSVTVQADGIWILTALDMIQIGGGHIGQVVSAPSAMPVAP